MTLDEIKDVLKTIPFKVKISGSAVVTNPPEEPDGAPSQS